MKEREAVPGIRYSLLMEVRHSRKKRHETTSILPRLKERNGYESRQISLLYVFAKVFGLDHQDKIVVYL